MIDKKANKQANKHQKETLFNRKVDCMDVIYDF